MDRSLLHKRKDGGKIIPDRALEREEEEEGVEEEEEEGEAASMAGV